MMPRLFEPRLQGVIVRVVRARTPEMTTGELRHRAQQLASLRPCSAAVRSAGSVVGHLVMRTAATKTFITRERDCCEEILKRA